MAMAGFWLAGMLSEADAVTNLQFRVRPIAIAMFLIDPRFTSAWVVV
jgi:hypothetical protein